MNPSISSDTYTAQMKGNTYFNNLGTEWNVEFTEEGWICTRKNFRYVYKPKAVKPGVVHCSYEKGNQEHNEIWARSHEIAQEVSSYRILKINKQTKIVSSLFAIFLRRVSIF